MPDEQVKELINAEIDANWCVDEQSERMEKLMENIRDAAHIVVDTLCINEIDKFALLSAKASCGAFGDQQDQHSVTYRKLSERAIIKFREGKR